MITIMLGLMVIWISGAWFGMSMLYLYVLVRMIRSDGWDQSNLTNAMRLVSHVVLHPEDFGRMWYVNSEGRPYKRPFWYLGMDEFESVVSGRPEEDVK